MSAAGDLVRRAAGGDPDARAVLATRWRPRARRTALAVLGDRDAAEDVAQEAMIRLDAALPGFRGDADLGTWLHRVTLNLCYDHLRRIRRRREEGPPPETAETGSVDPHARVDAERARAALQGALDRLSEDQREALVLRFVSDLSYAEIARTTGVPAGTVASRIFRALTRLGSELEPKHLEILR